jgi:hypothetical protein
MRGVMKMSKSNKDTKKLEFYSVEHYGSYEEAKASGAIHIAFVDQSTSTDDALHIAQVISNCFGYGFKGIELKEANNE